MRFFNKHSVNTTVGPNNKIIILLPTLVGVLLATPTAATRFKEYKQQWKFSRNTEPDWKVPHTTTTGTSIMASDRNKEVVNLFQGHDSEGGGADIKPSQNNDTNIYWEIIVDNAGGRRYVSGVRRSEVGVGMNKPLTGINASDEEDTTKDQLQTGHVGLKLEVSGDDKEKRNMGQEPTTSRGMKEVFGQFYKVAGYFAELLDFEGKVLFVLLKSAARTKIFVNILKYKAGNVCVRMNVTFSCGYTFCECPTRCNS
jgi:hypothetical protein